jgi:hypothetical protein
MKKREHFYNKVEELKARYRNFSSDYLRNQLPRMSIKECVAAARAVLAEREDQEISN